MENDKLKILVDADACPAKAQVVRIAKKFKETMIKAETLSGVCKQTPWQPLIQHVKIS